MKKIPELFTVNITFLTQMPSSYATEKYREATQNLFYEVVMKLLTKPEKKEKID